MGSRRTGSLIGAIAGLIFVVLNAGPLGGAVVAVARVLGVAGFGAAIWYIMRRPADDARRPDRRALRIYWLAVAIEVLAIVVGAQVLARGFHRADLTVPWVVFVVGVHFLPFAATFGAPLFRWLAWSLIVVAIAGAGLSAVLSTGPSWTGVAAGVVLLGFAVAGARRGGTSPAR
ncbi:MULTISPECIES: hypothetical protein [unclassified Nocardia]|uniref:hypothetical protein n=1 Tax=unclassified Nocardia TaxID=2637762 RepID=UPI001CE42C51|nr:MULTISPECIES: hypothetical protein [unclassified Nocardia]